MPDITHVLSEKYKGMEWSLNGDASTEAEFNEGFTIHKANGVAKPTWAKLQTQLAELQAEYDNKQYQRDRKVEYNKLNQFEMQFDDQRDGTTTWVDAINGIKDKYPKEI
jgi:hypothetical protein